MNCPRCTTAIRLFSSEGQGQQANFDKKCPACKADVELAINGRKFSVWLFATGSVFAASLMFLANTAWPVAAFFGFMLGALTGFVPSLEARRPVRAESGVRAWLHRRIEWPQWLSPPGWMRAIGRGVWAAGSFLLIVLIAILNLPVLWAGAALVAFGLLCHWKKEAWFLWFKLEEWAAQAYAAALVVAGLLLLAIHFR